MKLSLKGNSAAAAGEQIVVGITYFVFYGLLIRIAGAEQVGVVSLVLVLASLVSMTSSGFASALSHYVPLFEGRGERISTIRCIETTLLCTAALYGAVLVIAYVPFTILIVAQAGPEHDALVRELMVPATFQVFFLGVGATTNLGLTAIHRSDLRLWATVAGTVIGLSIMILGAPRYGVVAGLWALGAQSATITFVGWFQLYRALPGVPLIPCHFHRGMARQLMRLGMNMQLQSLLVSGAEPVTRLLLGQFGTLAAVAYFSLANRFVLQMRALLYAGAQPLLPAFSQARSSAPDALAALYRQAEAVMALAAIIIFSATAGAGPFVAEIWIGQSEPDFIVFTMILALGWLANTLTLAAYFNAYSLGKMTWSFVGHVALFTSNLVVGAVLGRYFGSVGVVAGMGAALLLSSMILKIGNGRHAPLSSRANLGKTTLGLVGGVIAAAFATLTYGWLREIGSPLLSGVGCGLVWLAVMMPVIWLQPATPMILSALRSRPRANEPVD